MSDVSAIRPIGNPWTPRFLFVLVISSVLVTAAVCARCEVVNPVSILFPLAAAILAVVAWTRFQHGTVAWIFLATSALIAAVGLSMSPATPADWSLLILTYALISVYQSALRRFQYSLLLIAPVLIGLLFLNAASLLGHTSSGGFPAAFGVLLTFILLATRELELRTPLPEDANVDPHVHILHRKALAWISIVFFVFGVISFWPWLGKLYGDAYFWTLIAVVLAPLLYLWGRLRQPRHQNSLTALHRFNRLVPYLGLGLLLAIALG